MQSFLVNGGEAGKPRGRACEACREAKVRCRASQQPGICQKCFDSKKECVSRSGPRTRRSKKAIIEAASAPSASPGVTNEGSSSTFSINFALSAQPEVGDNFDDLRSMHERHIESILPRADYLSSSRPFSGDVNDRPPSPSLTPSSSAREYPITELDGKPQFSLSSAESLLEHFRLMSPNLPCITLPPDVTVQQLAATKPFLLLAILTSASAAKTIQGHNLYDAEFRKVLGLKFVAAGERSLEMFQGLLVYCAWYPFHIRPQNKHLFQYVRMGGDMVNDLGLDDDCSEQEVIPGSEEHMERLRAYLGYTYLESVFTTCWGPPLRSSTKNLDWVLRCCDVLEQRAAGPRDLTLATLAREGVMYSQAGSALYLRRQKTAEERKLLLLGLKTQCSELHQQMPVEVASSNPIILTTLFLDLFINSAGLLERHSRLKPWTSDGETLPPDPFRLVNAVAPTRRFLDHISSLDRTAFLSLTAIDWCRLILAIIVAIRLSLPLDRFPEFDSAWARSEIQLAAFLDHLCPEHEAAAPESSAKLDTLAATRIILGIVKRKFNDRVQIAQTKEAQAMRGLSHIGCPYLDGTMGRYMSQWVAESTVQVPTPDMTPQFEDSGRTRDGTANAGGVPVFHDIWATMTMGWANTDA